MIKTVWMVCGNRGGVGKTLVSLALVSCLMSIARRQVAVLDGDGRSPDVHAACVRKIPARAADFRKLRPDRYDDMSVFDYESIVQNLLTISTDLVINTPDGADDVLMEWFDSTLRFTESANVRFVMLYVMNHRENGLDILPELARRFAFLFPIRNLHFARADAFTVFQENHADGFRLAFDFPRLRDNEVTQLLADQYLPAEFVETRGGHALSRQRVKNWLAESANVFMEIMDIDVANSNAVPLYNVAV